VRKAATIQRLDLYDVVEEESFRKRFDELRQGYDRMEHVHEAMTFQVARAPYSGEKILPDDDNHRVMRTYSVGETPSFLVLYRIDRPSEQVVLLSLAAEDSETLNG